MMADGSVARRRRALQAEVSEVLRGKERLGSEDGVCVSTAGGDQSENTTGRKKEYCLSGKDKSLRGQIRFCVACVPNTGLGLQRLQGCCTWEPLTSSRRDPKKRRPC